SEKRPVRLEVNKRVPDGSFLLTPIPTGIYTLAVLLDGKPLLTLEGIAVSGRTDLGTIDLTSHLHTCKLELLDAPQPEQLTGLMVWRESTSTEAWVTRPFKGTEIVLASATVPIDVWVRPNGYRHGFLKGVSGSAEFRIALPLIVQITVRTEGHLPT